MSLMTVTKGLTMSAAALALSTGLAAAAPAVAETDLNIRSGPGVDFDVVGVIPAGAVADVRGCRGSWCRVNFDGMPGFAGRDYLALGGAAVGRTVVGEGYYGGGYYAGYEPGYRTYGYESGRGYYGGRGYGEFRGERTEGVGARVEGRERFSSRETRGERLGVNERRSERFNSRAERGRVGLRGEESRVGEIGGNNPMKNPKSSSSAARGPQSGQAAAIGGNNPMKNASGSTNAGARATTGAAARGERRENR